MPKENLVMLHSFPTNSILLGGLIDYLSDFFDVSCIDLPGFTKTTPSLAEISFENYAKFAQQEIEELNLASYWLGGVSFGFFIASLLQPDPHCQGFLAMEPYIGAGSLRMSRGRRLFYRLFCRSVLRWGIVNHLWTNPLCRRYLPKLRPYPAEHVEIMFEQIDSRTFFETALLILENKKRCSFQNLPYILIANKEDQTLDYETIHSLFTAKVRDLLVIHTTIDHYPSELSKSYFRSQIPEAVIQQVFRFMPV